MALQVETIYATDAESFARKYGKKIMKITDTEISNRATPLVDRPYALGDMTGTKGWDCLSALGAFYGDSIPREFKGITEKNYAELWKKDESKARELLAEFLLSLGENTDPAHILRGDLVIFQSPGQALWAGIYLGDGKLWVCLGPKHGCHVIPMRQFISQTDEKIVSIRRILQ